MIFFLGGKFFLESSKYGRYKISSGSPHYENLKKILLSLERGEKKYSDEDLEDFKQYKISHQ